LETTAVDEMEVVDLEAVASDGLMGVVVVANNGVDAGDFLESIGVR
jgi:hypothetical protein